MVLTSVVLVLAGATSANVATNFFSGLCVYNLLIPFSKSYPPSLPLQYSSDLLLAVAIPIQRRAQTSHQPYHPLPIQLATRHGQASHQTAVIIGSTTWLVPTIRVRHYVITLPTVVLQLIQPSPIRSLRRYRTSALRLTSSNNMLVLNQPSQIGRPPTQCLVSGSVLTISEIRTPILLFTRPR